MHTNFVAHTYTLTQIHKTLNIIVVNSNNVM